MASLDKNVSSFQELWNMHNEKVTLGRSSLTGIFSLGQITDYGARDDIVTRFGSKHTWAEMVKECSMMYVIDDSTSAAIRNIIWDTFLNDSEGLPFKILVRGKYKDEITADEKLELEMFLNGEIKRLGLLSEAKTIMRRLLLWGDEKYEMVVDFKKRKLLKVVRLLNLMEGYYTSAVYNADGEVRGYEQYQIGDIKPEREFAEWQVIWLKWDDTFVGKGLPFFASARENFKRLKRSEIDISNARAEGAYLRFIFKPGGEATIQKLKEVMKENEKMMQIAARTNKRITNLYATGDVQVVDPENKWLNINDMNFQKDSLKDSIVRPHGLSGSGGRDVNRSTLDRQMRSYYGGLVNEIEEKYKGFLQKVLDMICLLSQVDLEKYDIHISFTKKKVIDELEESQVAAALEGVTYMSNSSKCDYLNLDYYDELEQMRLEKEKRIALGIEEPFNSQISADIDALGDL